MQPITFNTTTQRFETEVDGHTAFITVEPMGEAMAFTHTIVPDAIGGRGVAGQLTRYALEYATQHKWQVVPLCSYTRAYIGKHPEFAHLAAQP